MASKKKRQPAPNAQAAKPAAPPPPAVPETKDGGSAGRLGLIIVIVGVLAVLAIGGAFVFMNQGNTPPTEPPLAAGWNVGPVNLCRGSPEFPITKLGFSRNVVFSTSERLNKGMELIEPGADGSLTNARRYQDPSWTMGGYLGTFVADKDGNVYVVPSPRISLIDNPPEKANIIYKIDGKTGAMREYLNLPSAQPPSAENPYGILALTYDCDTNSLYVSTVMGSTRGAEVGRIYRVDLGTGKVAAQYDNVDAFGLAAYNQTTGKRLYFGSARNPDVRSIALDAQGNFSGEPRDELILTGTYNRPRRIDFNQRAQMLVRAIDFNFTLSATSEDRRTDYVFDHDETNNKWVQISP